MKYNGFLKRAFDIAISSTCLISLAIPVAGLTMINACLLKENPFYIAERVGKDGKVFNMIKLKSMRSAFDKNGKSLPDDQRRTKFGKFLRHTGFDELPQFINVLKGDMSLVGPRPISIEELNSAPERLKKFLISVRPGITGPWQVSAIGRETSDKERLTYDALYARTKITFFQDIIYMFNTIPSFWYGHNKPI